MRTVKVISRVDKSFAANRTVKSFETGVSLLSVLGRNKPYWSWDSFALVTFTDGAAIVLLTTHEGPYSEVTRDIDFSVELWEVEVIE